MPQFITCPQPAAEVYDTTWYIDHGPFYDRFGVAMMPVLLSTNATVVAIRANLASRKWIDLKLPAVAASLAAVGGIVTELDAPLRAAILSTPVAAAENFALRRTYFS